MLAAVLFHGYWAMPADQQRMQMPTFMKNLAVVGGMLKVVALDLGGFSLDARRMR